MENPTHYPRRTAGKLWPGIHQRPLKSRNLEEYLYI